MKFRLQFLGGSRAGTEIVVPGPMLRFGRDPSNEIAFDPVIDDKVSTNHAQLLFTDQGALLLTDLGSSNGTFINGQKVERPTPIASGAIVSFGGATDGVQVAISLVNEADPNLHKATMLVGQAAEDPDAKKGGKGKLLACFGCLSLLLIGGVVALVLHLTGDDPETAAEDEQTKTASADDADEGKTEGAKTEDAKTEDAKTEDAKTEAKDPPKEEGRKHPWENYKVGTRFVVKVESVAMVGGKEYPSTSTMTYELKELTDKKLVFSTTTAMKAMPKPMTTDTTIELPLKTSDEGEKPKVLEEKDETVKVPAGSFDCRYTKTETVAGGVTTVGEAWTREDLPCPVKYVGSSKASKTTMILVEVDKK